MAKEGQIGKLTRVMRQKYVYKPFVVSLSNHGRNVLKTSTLRLAQGERNLQRSVRRSTREGSKRARLEPCSPAAFVWVLIAAQATDAALRHIFPSRQVSEKQALEQFSMVAHLKMEQLVDDADLPEREILLKENGTEANPPCR